MWVYLTKTNLKELHSILGQVAQKGREQPYLNVTALMAETAAALLQSITHQTRPRRSGHAQLISQYQTTIAVLLVVAIIELLIILPLLGSR